uniref:Death domain-containing protein n=1 Tax=Macrostomum lignano TaxID=282301 RepID=A0A1I8G3G9_9PLAT
NFRDDRDRAFAVLCQWQRERGPEATGNDMERALRRIGRDDVVKKCMRNVEYVVGEDEKRQAKSLLDKQEAEDRHSGSNRSSQPPLEDVADDEAGAGDFVKPSVDERHGPPPPAKSEAEQAKEREAKSEAFLSLIDSMNSMTPEPEVHLPASDMEGQEAVQEEDIAAISREPAVEDPAAVEELLGKLDSLPAMSMAPEGDEEVDTPQAAPVSHTAPSQRDTPPPSPAERADDADDESRLKEEARQFAEGVMERQDDLQRHEQEREDLDNQQEGAQDDVPVEAIQLQQPLVEATPQSVPEVEPESKLEVEQEVQPEVEPEAQPEVEPEAEPEVEPEAQPEVEPEAEPEVEPEAQPEVEQEEPGKPAHTVS